MKENILHFLICPACGGMLDLESFIKEREEVKEGLLKCSCGKWYPIISFVPRMLLNEYRGNYQEFIKKFDLKNHDDAADTDPFPHPTDSQVQRSFSSKWTSQPTWGIRGETKTFVREWFFKKYGWGDIEGFQKAFKNKKRIIEIGTGVGGMLIEFCQACKDGEVFGVDLSEAVEAAYDHTHMYPNAHILQADLMNPPFKRGSFDFIFSEGVLHHTSNTQKALEALLGLLAREGEIAIYIYKKKGPIREFCDEYLRQFTTKLSEEECWEFSRRITQLGRALAQSNLELEIPEDIPLLEIKAGRYNLQQFFYYHILKCFWNDRFVFDENSLINFDWYHPIYAHRHTAEEIKEWFKNAGLNLIHLDVSESGITTRGVYAA